MKIFWPKRDDVSGSLRILPNKKICVLYNYMKSLSFKCAGNVTQIRKIRYILNFHGKPLAEWPLERLRLDEISGWNQLRIVSNCRLW